MTDEKFVEREGERALRLLAFVKDELRNMHVEARFSFTLKLFDYLTPEIKELVRKGSISGL